MSDISAQYGDYGIAANAAIRKRKQQSIANTQSATLGQLRGKRTLDDISDKYTKGFQPLVSSFGRRGLGGANVKSGIRTAGLEEYAKSLQKDLGRETENQTTDSNNLIQNETNQQAGLDDYLAQLRLEKSKNIINTAVDIKSLGNY
jgi:high-affinity K+ transport system ATPase subunit B